MAPLAAREIAALGFEQVICEAPLAVIVVDAAGALIHANECARAMAVDQLGREMPSGLADGEGLFHVDGRPCAPGEWPLVRSITSGEVVADQEFCCDLPGGGRRFVRAGSSPVRDERGEVVAGVLVLIDITRDVRTAQRLAYYDRLLEASEDAVIAVDRDLRITVWNRAAERLYGWSAEEALGRNSTELWQPIIDEEVLERFRREYAAHGRSRMEMTARCRDDTQVQVEWIVHRVQGARGEDLGRLGVHRDVTERDRALKALEQASSRSEAMIESITDAFYALDHDWRITYINTRAVFIAGQLADATFTREQLVGRSLWDVLPPKAGSFLESHYRRATREERPVVFEYHHPHSRVWFEVHAYPAEHGLSVYFHEVTDRKLAELERERRARQQALVSELGLRALASDDVQATMEEAVALVAEIFDVELAGVAETLPAGGKLRFRAGVGWDPGTVGNTAASVGRNSLVGYTVRAGEPVASEAVSDDARFMPSPLLKRHGVVSAAAVLVMGHDEPFGALAVFSRQPRVFSADDLQSLQAVANVISTAMERAAAERRLEDVREAERSRIARDLQEEALSGLTHALTVTARRGSPGDDEVFQTLQQVGRQLRGAIHELRLDDDAGRPFGEALAELVEVHDAMAPDCDVVLEAGERLPTGRVGHRGAEVLRIVGEAITVARRYTGANRIRVRGTGPEARLRIEVASEAPGTDPGPAASGSHEQRLIGMRESARLLDAHLDVRRRPSGIAVRLSVNLSPASAKPIRVLLVDEHATLREGLAAAFDHEPDVEIAGQAASLAQARRLLSDVDVLLVGLQLPDGLGADLIEDLRQVNPQAQALVLSGTRDRAEIARAVARGAGGVLDETTDLDGVVTAVRRVRSGETLLPLEEMIDLLRLAGDQREREHQDRTALAQLTPREREVLQAVAAGLNSREIADRLHISVRTERNHMANVLAKLGVHSQIQAVLLALRYGVVTVPMGAAAPD